MANGSLGGTRMAHFEGQGQPKLQGRDRREKKIFSEKWNTWNRG
jgi:hypothetical protein